MVVACDLLTSFDYDNLVPSVCFVWVFGAEKAAGNATMFRKAPTNLNRQREWNRTKVSAHAHAE